MSSDTPAEPDPGQAAFKIEFDFYAIIGRFVTSYAAAELAAHVALRSLAGLSDDHARIIFGGMRFGEIGERLRKLSAGTPVYGEIDALLTQLSIIGIERDRVAHRFTYIDQDTKPPVAVVSNHWNAKAFANAETHRYDRWDFYQMMADCDGILLRFRVISEGGEAVRDSLEKAPHDPFGPWLYKPPTQARKRLGRP